MLKVFRGVGLAILYGVGLYLLRDASSPHWYLPAGLRFAALLLLPRRYWLWVYAGECCSLFVVRIPLIELRGLAWVVVSTVTSVPPIAGVVYLIRRYTNAPVISSGRDVLAVLFGAGAAAITSTALNAASTYGLMRGAPTNPVPYVLGVWILGQYLGILMFSSIALLWRNRNPRHQMPHALRKEAFTAFSLMLAFLLAYRLGEADHQEAMTQVVRCSAAVIAFALTYRHGWRGGAIGVIALCLGVGLTAGPDYEPSTLAAQQVVAFVTSILIAAGAVMTHNYEIAADEALMRRLAEDAGRRAWADTEDQNMEHVGRAEAAYEQIMRQSDTIIGDLRRTRDPEDIMRLTGDLLATTRSATKSLMQEIYPAIVFSADGLFGALRAKRGTSGAQYRAAFRGDQDCLSRQGALSVYRVTMAALDQLASESPEEIRLRVRVGRINGQVHTYIRVRATVGLCRNNMTTASIARLRRRVITFGGSIHNKRGEIAMLLPDHRTQSEAVAQADSMRPASIS